MNDSKFLLLFNYLNNVGKVRFINKRLLKQFTNEDALELKLWIHTKKSSALMYKKKRLLSRDYLIKNLFNNDSKSLNRTASRLYKRIRLILIHGFLEDKPLIEEWIYRETLKEEQNRIAQIISENIISNKYETKSAFEKELNAYIQFQVTYEKYLEDSLQNYADASLFKKARKDLENYYIKYHSILETEKLQRERIIANENIETLQKPTLDTSQSLLESELLLQKVNSLKDNPQYFDFYLSWFTHLVEAKLVSEKMQKTIFPILYNFTLRNHSEDGELLQEKKLNEMLYLALDKKVLFTKGELSLFIYVNFLGTVSVVDAKRIETFVKKYLKQVNSQEYSKASYFSKIYIAFYNDKFEEVLKIINQNEDNVSLGFDISLKSKVNFFLIRTYFELKDEENFTKQYINSKRYYRGQNLPKHKEISSISSVEYMKELYYISNSNSLKLLEEKVISEDIAVKSWILKKIKESPFYPKS